MVGEAAQHRITIKEGARPNSHFSQCGYSIEAKHAPAMMVQRLGDQIGPSLEKVKKALPVGRQASVPG
jgi:hypothetical protein